MENRLGTKTSHFSFPTFEIQFILERSKIISECLQQNSFMVAFKVLKIRFAYPLHHSISESHVIEGGGVKYWKVTKESLMDSLVENPHSYFDCTI